MGMLVTFQQKGARMRPNPHHFILRSCVVLCVLLFIGVACAQHPDSTSPIDFYGAPSAGPAPLEVHFHYECPDPIASTVTSWSWTFGDGDSSQEDYTSHTYERSGAYTVSLTVKTSGGQTYTVKKDDYIVVDGEGPRSDTSVAERAQVDEAETEVSDESPDGPNGLVFIHHSCGENWLNHSLHRALVAKPYVDNRNDITYGVDISPDKGRPDSLRPVPGDLTDMHHWVLWFNDYLDSVRRHGSQNGVNRIVVFKSCFPNSHIDDEGDQPGDPFQDWKTLSNYKAVFRHPAGPGNKYEHGGHSYLALEDVFAAHPDTLFIAITAPPECWQDSDNSVAGRARRFNDWLKGEWLPAYAQRTGLHNVAVFDWFDVLANPSNDRSHPNQLRANYGGGAGDSHPNDSANARSTEIFATSPDNFLDRAWAAFHADSARE